MRHFLAVLSILVIGFSFIPSKAFALEPDDPELDVFLEEIGWEKQDYIDYLESKEWGLEYFDSVDELGTPLSEEGIQQVLVDFDLTREELNELLVEYGDIEEGQDVLDGTYLIFNEELSEYVDYYLNEWVGTPIDENNLHDLLEAYGFGSKEELEAYLNTFDDSIENYEYIEDLEIALDIYQTDDEALEEIQELFDSIGLTEEEIEKLFLHIEAIDFDEAALLELSERMIGLEEFENVEELTAEQIAELLDIFNDLQNIFQIQTKYYLVKDGVKTDISMESLMKMTSSEGYDLLIEIYSTNGDFLLDVLFTADMLGSEVIAETGKDIQKAEEIITNNKTVAAKTVAKTVKGGKLPNTDSNYVDNTLIGFGFVLVGAFLFLRHRKREMVR
ncbi:processed acidic surface protein [Robertmurraya sp. P23]|uniref:processed acidic surface protein n=1 Tax=Robertmurraya sp. P23 TaxID=3436931 RepID=UPI003D97D3B4